MNVEWYPQAIEGRKMVADYIRCRFGFKHKRKFNQEVDQAVRMIKKHPSVGPVEPLLADRASTYRSLVVDNLSKIVYRVDDDTIHIVDFWDCRREPKALASQVK